MHELGLFPNRQQKNRNAVFNFAVFREKAPTYYKQSTDMKRGNSVDYKAASSVFGNHFIPPML